MSITKTIHAEFYKFHKTSIWPILFISPILMGLSTFYISFGGFFDRDSASWMTFYSMMTSWYGMLLLPLLTGVIAALVCRYEHLNGNWKQYLVQPVRRWQVYLMKFGMVAFAIAVMQILMLLALLVVGNLYGVDQAFPFKTIITGLLGGWIATFPLIALQLWVSVAWSSFAAPMAINVICTIPSILIAQSATYGPYYPWSQPLLAMMPQGQSAGALFISAETLFLVVAGSFLIFFTGGLIYFQKRAYS